MKRTIILLLIAFIAAKFLIAFNLNLHGDEAFYWQCGRRPDLSYIDHPPLTAMFVRAGTGLFGDTHFGVRFLFLLCGAVFPFAVYFLAKPVAGERDAWLAAAATIVLPGTAYLGLLAVPDVPMLLSAVCSVLFFEQATRENKTSMWLMTGICGAIGLLIHYRFILIPAAAGLYLVLTPRGRELLRHKGPWTAGSVMLIGLIPAVINNIRTDFEPLRYYLAGRHGATVNLNALFQYVAEQIVGTTPFLLFALILVLVRISKKALKGDDRAGFFAILSLFQIIVFLLASPFGGRQNLETAHWPVAAYVFLFPFLPETVRGFVNARRSLPRKVIAVLIPGFAGLLVLLSLFELTTGFLKLGSLRRPFVGWTKIADRVRQEYLPVMRSSEGNNCIIVADNYVLGAHLEFHLHDVSDVYILDHKRNRKHGRGAQYSIWNIGEAGLGERSGENALVVMKTGTIETEESRARLGYVQSFFEALEPLGELRIRKPRKPWKPRQDKVYKFFHGVNILPKPTIEKAGIANLPRQD